MSRIGFAALFFSCLLPAGCTSDGDDTPPAMNAIRELDDLRMGKNPPAAKQGVTTTAPASANVETTGTFQVEFITTVGRFVVEVNREWAPIGADRFQRLVGDQFFDDCAFFRVVPGFIAQFGLPADPNQNDRWSTPLADDPVVQSNTRGTVVFATSGPQSRTTQLFINFGDNTGSLDRQGFSPFGRVVEGMDVVDRISSRHGETPNQGEIKDQGNAYLSRNFPDLTYIQTARILTPGP